MAAKKSRCRYPKCDRVIVYHPKTSSWVHQSPGADHAPIPGKEDTNGER